MATNKNRVVWLDRGWLPPYLGFCPNERAWKRELPRLEVPLEPYPTSDARLTSFWASNTMEGTSKLCMLLTIHERFDTIDDTAGVLGLIVHEATHAWQIICKNIGEKKPGSELEAYAMQSMVGQICGAYEKTRKVKFTHALPTKPKTNRRRK